MDRAQKAPNPAALALAARLRVCVERVGGQIMTLSRRAGVHRRALGRYLAGEHQPKYATLQRLAQAAGVRLAWLAHGEEPMVETVGPHTDVDHAILHDALVSILEMHREVPGHLTPTAHARLIVALYEYLLQHPQERTPEGCRAIARLLMRAMQAHRDQDHPGV